MIYEQLKYESRRTKPKEIKIIKGPEKPIKIAFKSIDDGHVVDSIDEILNNLDYFEKNFLVSSKEEDTNAMPDKLTKVKSSANSQHKNINIIKADRAIHHLRSINELNYQEAHGYKLQLAMTKTEPEAKKQWRIIVSKNEKSLSGAKLILKKIAKNNKHFFLVMAGPYNSQYKAKLVCESLKKNKQNCLIVK